MSASDEIKLLKDKLKAYNYIHGETEIDSSET